MDPFHERLARLALARAASYGFCLAGGYAVQAHGFVDRVSKDIDLFTTLAAATDFDTAQAEVIAALRADGLTVTVDREGSMFARLAVADPVTGQSSAVELGVDWRAYPPVQLAIGPVLHPADAAANKICALFSRAAVRDYVDVHGLLVDGRYSGEELLALAVGHDAGFDKSLFAAALRAVRRLPAAAFARYRLTSTQVAALQTRLLAWADEIETGREPT